MALVPLLVVLVIIVAIVLILQRVGVPANIIQIAWIVVAAIVAIYAIKYLVAAV